MARGPNSMLSPNMSAGRTVGSSTRPTSLLFSLEDGFEKLGPSSSLEPEYDPILEVQQIKQASGHSDAEQKLFAALQEAKASSILAVGAVDLWHVGSYLRSKYGYLVLLRHANVAKRPKAYLRMLRHSYLVCRGLEGADGVDVLMDLNFKDHFVLPHSTSWYSKLVAVLPQDWVGTATALAPLVGLMSAGMRLCFKQAGIPLPPWREGRAVLSKWVPEVYEETALPFVPLPDPALRRMLAPYHTPFRSAVKAAAAIQPAVLPSTNAQLQQPQQQAGVHGAGLQLPPLPRPSSGAVLAAAAVKAAAAGGTSSHAAAAMADVPRKIIVGFPDQRALPLPCPAAHISAAAAAAAEACGAPAHSGAMCAMLAGHQQLQGQQMADVAAVRPPAATGSAMTAMFALQAAETTVHGGKHAGGLQVLPQASAVTSTAALWAAPCPATAATGEDAAGPRSVARSPAGALTSVSGGPVFAAAATAAATAAAVSRTVALTPIAAAAQGCSAVVELVPSTAGCGKAAQQQQGQQAQQPQQQQQQVLNEPMPLARPAFTSNRSVVAASAGSSSPGIVISRDWLRQQLGQHVVPDGEAAVATDSSQIAPGDGPGNTSKDAAGPAPADGGAGMRQFKTLDQLLPRMRTVKLGAA